MSKPIENCPKYTAEQVEAMAADLRDAPGTSMLGTHISVSTGKAVAMYEALTAYAERIEADEMAVPFGYLGERELQTMRNLGHAQLLCRPLPDLNITTPVYLHPPAQAAQVDKPPRLGGCCCGEPCTLGTVHRTDGPCFMYEQPADSGRVDVVTDYYTGRNRGGWAAPRNKTASEDAANAAQGQGEAVAGAPSIEAAEAMGAKGGPCVEAERLAFEAWMRGHCWALCATWNGTGYLGDAEQGGNIDPRAIKTRGLWAAWRDRAALAATAASPAGVPDGMVLVPRWIIGNTLRAIRDVDTQFRATGHPSWRFEQLANLLAPLAAAPSAPEGDGGGK